MKEPWWLASPYPNEPWWFKYVFMLVGGVVMTWWIYARRNG